MGIAFAAATAVYLTARYRTPRQIIMVLLIPWIAVCGAGYYLDEPMHAVRFAFVIAGGLVLVESLCRELIHSESGWPGRNRIGA
jgi:hypothetical protein